MRGRRALALAAATILAACSLEPRESREEAFRGADEAVAPRGATLREVIHSEKVASLPVFSPAVRAGGFIFLSGAIGVAEGTLELVEGGVEAEARQTMENIGDVLAAAGATFDDVVKCTVFLADMADYAAVNAVYAEYFPSDPPARSAVAGSGLALGARVEIECLALDRAG
jgi:reactive intermediate/imine deaminase